MTNLAFLYSIGVTNEATQQKCLAAMEKYGGNRWWEEVKSNPRKFAYYQLNEPISLCEDFGQFHEALELLVGHPVWTHELIDNHLKQQAQKAWNAIK